MVILCCSITTHLLGLGRGTGPGGRHADILHVHATANGYASVSDIHHTKTAHMESDQRKTTMDTTSISTRT